MKKPVADQSARFIEAAKAAGADETGKEFERAFKKIVRRVDQHRAMSAGSRRPCAASKRNVTRESRSTIWLRRLQ